jgi:dTMP kinase
MPDLRGKFIVFDGGEGCGKSTQSQLLKAALEASGTKVLLVRDPGTTRVGEMVRSILLNPDNHEINMRCEMLLYMAARAQMMSQIILPALAQGQTVISDRFVSSTLAYQLGGDGLTAEQIRSVAEIAIQQRWPDLTILLDMPTNLSLSRVKRERDRIEQRPMEYHEQVRQNYLAQAAAMPERYRVVDGNRAVSLVQADVLAAVRSLV